MVRADFTFKFWSPVLGCMSLEYIFRELETEKIETDTYFSHLLTFFPTSKRKPGVLFSAVIVCMFWRSHTKACVCHSRMGRFQFCWKSLLKAEALKHWSCQTSLVSPSMLTRANGFGPQMQASHLCVVIWCSFIISTVVFWNDWFSVVYWLLNVLYRDFMLFWVYQFVFHVLVTLFPSENAITQTLHWKGELGK